MRKSNQEAKALEILVAKIQRHLAPNAEVIHDAKLVGRNSGVKRQIDVLVKDTIGQYELIIAIECKDYSRPASVQTVEAFQGTLSDINAHKGVLVCPSGFTKAALRTAEKFGIETYSPIDTDPNKWQVESLSIPAICDFRGCAVSLGIHSSHVGPFKLPANLAELEVYSRLGIRLGNYLDLALRNWSQSKYPTDVGEHLQIPLSGDGHFMTDNGYGDLVNVELKVGLKVDSTLYKGHLQLTNLKGFHDRQKDVLITNAFEFLLDPSEVENNWEAISGINEHNPDCTYLIGLYGYFDASKNDPINMAIKSVIGRTTQH